MSSQLPSKNPTAYVGVYPLNPGNIVFHHRDPDNLLDVNNYNPGDTWMNPKNNNIFMLMRDFNLAGGGKQAVWVSITGGGGGGGIQNLQGDYGVVIAPSGGLCSINGSQATRGIFTTGILPSQLTISCDYATAGLVGVAHTGVCSFNSANFTVVNGFVSAIAAAAGLQTLTTDDGHVVTYTGAGNITVNGTAAQGISTTGNIAGNEIAITAANATAGANVGLTQKGVCSFNSANFAVVNGFVSAIPVPVVVNIQTVTTDDGHVVSPTAGGNLTVNGSAGQGISTTGNIAGNEIAVTAANATNAGGKGVSTYTASQFNVAAGLVSLTGKNPTLPAFKAILSASILNCTGDNTVVGPIKYNSVLYDQTGSYNPVTGIYTVPVTGIYLIQSLIMINGLLPGHFLAGAYFTLNGAGLLMIQNNPYANAYILGAQKSTTYLLSTCHKCTAGNTLNVNINVAGATKVVSIMSTVQNSFFSASLIA